LTWESFRDITRILRIELFDADSDVFWLSTVFRLYLILYIVNYEVWNQEEIPVIPVCKEEVDNGRLVDVPSKYLGFRWVQSKASNIKSFVTINPSAFSKSPALSQECHKKPLKYHIVPRKTTWCTDNRCQHENEGTKIMVVEQRLYYWLDVVHCPSMLVTGKNDQILPNSTSFHSNQVYTWYLPEPWSRSFFEELEIPCSLDLKQHSFSFESKRTCREQHSWWSAQLFITECKRRVSWLENILFVTIQKMDDCDNEILFDLWMVSVRPSTLRLAQQYLNFCATDEIGRMKLKKRIFISFWNENPVLYEEQKQESARMFSDICWIDSLAPPRADGRSSSGLVTLRPNFASSSMTQLVNVQMTEVIATAMELFISVKSIRVKNIDSHFSPRRKWHGRQDVCQPHERSSNVE